MRVLSVNVGLPREVEWRNEPVTTAIHKLPVSEPVQVRRLNLEGDAQADLSVHGGPDKAVYVYPSEHLPLWAAELNQEMGPASFGENVSTAGVREQDVWIGDRWFWGDAVLEVAQPRSPCFKLAMHRGRGDIGRLLRRSGRCGWYLRVLQPGSVAVQGPIRIERTSDAATATVAAVNDALWSRDVDADQLE